MKKFFMFILTALLYSSMSYSLDWKKCSKEVGVADGLGLFITTSSYISSTGACSMLGFIEHDQILFITQAYEPLQMDLARGNGEFVDAFAEISKCNSLGKGELKRALQKNYGQIYKDANIENVEKTYSKIIDIMKLDQDIANNCKVRSSI